MYEIEIPEDKVEHIAECVAKANETMDSATKIILQAKENFWGEVYKIFPELSDKKVSISDDGKRLLVNEERGDIEVCPY